MTNPVITHIIEELQEIQHGKPWIGSSFHKKLATIDEALVFKRPMEDLHSVAEIISHLTLWRTEAILKIETGKGSKTDDCEENWLSNEKLKPKGWKTILSEYENSLSVLIELLKDKEDAFLTVKYYDTDFKDYYEYKFLLNGMLHHDIYHLGQLGIILKYLNKN